MGDFFLHFHTVFYVCVFFGFFFSCRFFMARLDIGKLGACLVIYMKLLHLQGHYSPSCDQRNRENANQSGFDHFCRSSSIKVRI